jgi:hypothetical protein
VPPARSSAGPRKHSRRSASNELRREVTDVLRRLTLVALLLTLLFAQAANAQPGKGQGQSDPRGNAWGLTGFSDGR